MIRLAPAEIALSGFCGLLAIILIYEIGAPLTDFQVPSANFEHKPRNGAAMQPFVPPPMALFDVINERPVFSPLRKPIAAGGSGVAGVGGPALDPIDISLVGIILDPQHQLALLKTTAAPAAVSLGVGGMIEGWTISQIRSDRVVIHSGSSDREILLNIKTPPAGAAPDNGQ